MASAKIRWGILGCARIAERALIPAFHEAKNAELFGIAARDKARAAAWAAKFKIPKFYGNYEELLQDPDIQAVYIPLPNHLHAEWTINAARAGKHILCEKPLALSASEVESMFAAARASSVQVLEAFMYRFHPQFDKTLALVRSGTIGDIRAVHATFSFVLSGPKDDYRRNAGMGGGALYDVGCYVINASRTIIGAEPETVFAKARLEPETGIDLATSLLLEFPDDRHALLDCAFDAQFQSRVEVAGSRGRITLSRAFSAKHFDVEVQITKGNNIETHLVPARNQYTRMVEHFGEAVLGLRPVLFGESDALGNARVIDAAFASLATGRCVAINKRTIINEEAP
jgi:D-xylose 1-dehydrogenase (NADP+, D-xylono-1,5-lactone-forming)